MIEIVFNDSACGSLKQAQHLGKSKYRGECIDVFISHCDGTRPTREEIEEAKRQAQEKARLSWECVTPMGLDTTDIYGLHMALSIGDISDRQFELNRRQVLEHLFSIYPNDQGANAANDIMNRLTCYLAAIQKRVEEGEAVRIWYSNHPDEMCGLYWFMSQLNSWKRLDNEVYMIKLPEWEISESGNMVQKISWSEVAPEEWNRYPPKQQLASSAFKKHCVSCWCELQNENAPLRAVLNGRLVSVHEDIYDSFIYREISNEEETFREAMIIGRVLGKYQLGIGDGWVALRIEEMIRAGKLEIISEVTRDMPIYHRMLKRKMPLV